MRVKDCQKCKHHSRRTFNTYHTPKNYHAVVFSHAYGYCEKHKKRCSAVKKCTAREEENPKAVISSVYGVMLEPRQKE